MTTKVKELVSKNYKVKGKNGDVIMVSVRTILKQAKMASEMEQGVRALGCCEAVALIQSPEHIKRKA